MLAKITALLVCLTIITSGCAVAAPETDFLGYPVPAQCRDVSGIDIPVIEVAGEWLDKAAGGETGGLYGLWSRIHVIYVRDDLRPGLRARVIEHEKCHEAMWRLTGDPRWHRGHPW
jgi:hypothetical protein